MTEQPARSAAYSALMWPKRNDSGDHDMNADKANALLDAFAHELAEKIRNTELPEIHVDMFDNGTQWAADLIDRPAASAGGESR
ncbi:hypothetical protein ACFQ6Q_04375 [Streptomyces sp. NPDC056437]|uniref:hypothetical protein n=1 Tax=Streptomyces sp. NPDC056437 TaxID=3345816 RepID=UPI0036A0D6AB